MVGRSSKVTGAMVRDATVRDVRGDEIVLLTPHAPHVGRIEAQAALLTDALHEVLGGAWRLRVELGGDARARPTPAPDGRTAGSPPRDSGAQPTAMPAPPEDSDWPEAARPGGSSDPPAAKPAPARAARPAQRGGRGRGAAQPADAPAPARDFGGFDPGDEPLDDGTPGTRQSSEEQALRAVTEHFAVERIGDTGPR
jgi:DNA polymerase-3 subunit gamma/tau